MDPETRREYLEKRFGPVRRTGGKGTVRQVRRKRPSQNNMQDMKLKDLLEKSRINNVVTDITALHIIKNDESVINVKKAEVKAMIQSNIFAISGEEEKTTVEKLMPDVLRKLNPQMRKKYEPLAGETNNYEFPDLVDDFEKISMMTNKIDDTKDDKKDDTKDDTKNDTKDDTKDDTIDEKSNTATENDSVEKSASESASESASKKD